MCDGVNKSDWGGVVTILILNHVASISDNVEVSVSINISHELTIPRACPRGMMVAL